MRVLFVTSIFTFAALAQEAPPAERRPFVRCVERDDGGQLDVLIATYTKGDATLVLHGALHVADPEHYAELQKRFAAFDALLYELVAPEDLLPHPGMELGESDWFSMLQGALGRGLGLADQCEQIDYRLPNFVHADMTDAEWEAALERARSSLLGEIFYIGAMTEPDRDAEALRPKEDFVAAARAGTQTHELRRAFARLLAEPDGTRREPTVIIEARNERCLDVLQQQLAVGKKKIGIWYGAAHMEHMERRLVRDLGWVRAGEEWLMAWDNRASRFPPAEKGLQQKRYRARQDVDALTDALRAWTKANPGKEPTWDLLREARPARKLPGRADGQDPWGRPYELRMRSGKCEVRCRGSDGELDTDDDLAGDTVSTKKPGLIARLFAYKQKHEEYQQRFEEARRQHAEDRRRAGAQTGLPRSLEHEVLALRAAMLRLEAAAFEAEHGRKATAADLPEHKDRWGNPLRVVIGSDGVIDVRSDGPDGKPDTADDIVDAGAAK